MPVVKLQKFNDIFEVETFLNGGLIGGDVKGGVTGLVGLQLTFANPAGTVTFTTGTGTDPYKLSFKDIKSQIEAQVATVKVTSFGGRIVFMEATPTSGVSFPATAQQSKALLGFDADTALGGKKYQPTSAGASPNVLDVYSVNETTHVVVTWE